MTDAGSARDDDRQFVTFYVGSDHFGLPISSIRDVFTFHHLTRVPLASGSVAGLFNLRGRIVTMLSMRALLGQPETQGQVENETSRAIGIDLDGDSYGLIVDSMGEVMQPADAMREPVPGNLVRTWGDLAAAVYRQPNGLMIELSVDALLGKNARMAA